MSVKDAKGLDASVEEFGSLLEGEKNFLPKNELVFIVLKRPKPVDSKPSKLYEVEVVDLKGDLTTMSVTAGDYKKIRKAAERVLDVQKRYPNLPLIPYVKISSALPFQQPMNAQR
ncbi:MAG: hypothetical protein NWF00_03145 [Candidatus Bathyarchaeota archaeon]|nr:hypothetical protein [Candidatus Bathyarchaeota archaeon]